MNFDFEKIYEDETVLIEVDNSLGFIHVIWRQHPDSDAYRRAFANATEICLSRKCRFWLSDSRKVHYLEFADQNWMLRDMVPLLGNSCLHKFARINSEESLSLLDIDRVLSGLEQSPDIKINVEVALFIDRQQALNWLFPNGKPQEVGFLQKWGKSIPASPENSPVGTPGFLPDKK
jgi:hypothetical protein